MFSQSQPAVPITWLAAYSARERHLVIERYVPDIEVIPDVSRYDINRNLSLRTLEISERDRGNSYLSFIAQVALLSLDRIFRTEITNVVATATVNCRTVMRNPATGHLDVIYVLSATAPHGRFVLLNLLGVDPLTCIYSLNGRMTASPGHYAAVAPWAKAEALGDVVITVGNTPILEMSPSDFEQLVTELLRRMGLRAQRTGRSGDGGVDCVAYDDRPVVGGKVIVRVKRYANTVAPSVVRDLFGTVLNSKSQLSSGAGTVTNNAADEHVDELTRKDTDLRRLSD
jgi:restriction system protein